jgi:hypothetical protein
MNKNLADLTEVYKKYGIPLGPAVTSAGYIVSQEPATTAQVVEWAALIIAEKDREITNLRADLERLRSNEEKVFDALHVVGGAFNTGFQQLNGLRRNV